MKRIINTILAAALLAVSVISCQKAEEIRKKDSSSEISKKETISVSLTATMDELTPADIVKSGVTPVIRLTWAPEGDEVFVYDASKCLGTLDVSLKDDDVRYAYLSGTIEHPSEGTKVLTCIHAKGLSEAPSVESGKVTNNYVRFVRGVLFWIFFAIPMNCSNFVGTFANNAHNQ